ncbi:hypothetical protein [Flavobacterium sp.]|uniref:hypothetical protein n=1 Tax=Flavobacterium sp. TaxID=239 RepID=UPI0039E6CDE3
MKKLGLFLFIMALIVSCSARQNATAVSNPKQANYIPYYLKVEQAKKLYTQKENQKCFELLDSLFNQFKPINTLFVDELEIYAELALERGKKDKLDAIVEILISDYGYDVADYEGELWENLRKQSQWSHGELKNKYLVFRKNLNVGLRDSIIEIFKKDQSIRRMTKDEKKIDSVDRINEPYIVHFIKRYGYPDFRLVGGNGNNETISPAYLSVLLKHLSLPGAMELEPILLDEVKKGKCPRDIYAGMLDVHTAVLKQETPYTYLGTYKDYKPTDKAATNRAREKIGLPAIPF